jgi:hypothetical protein
MRSSSLFSALSGIVVLCSVALDVAPAHATTTITVETHVVRPNDHARVVRVSPGASASPAHPDGSVYAIVVERTTTDLAPPAYAFHLAELDLRTGATIHKLDRDCSSVLHAGRHVYATCGADIVSLDPSLAIEWRVTAPTCAGDDGVGVAPGVELAFDGAHLLVAAFACDRYESLFRTVDTTTQRILGDARGAFVDRHTQLWFHGATVLGLSQRPGSGPQPQWLFVLSPDYKRVANTVDLGGGESVEDDGVHAHVSLSKASNEEVKAFDEPYPPSSAEKPRVRVRPRWLALDREFILSDALVPIASIPLDFRPPEPQPPSYSPTVAGGQRIVQELDHGPVHMWLTQECCGGGNRNPPGLYAGRTIVQLRTRRTPFGDAR